MVENVVDLERSFQLVTAEGEVAAERQVAGVPGLGMVLRDVGHRLIAFACVYETVVQMPAAIIDARHERAAVPGEIGNLSAVPGALGVCEILRLLESVGRAQVGARRAQYERSADSCIDAPDADQAEIDHRPLELVGGGCCDDLVLHLVVIGIERDVELPEHPPDPMLVPGQADVVLRRELRFQIFVADEGIVQVVERGHPEDALVEGPERQVFVVKRNELQNGRRRPFVAVLRSGAGFPCVVVDEGVEQAALEFQMGPAEGGGQGRQQRVSRRVHEVHQVGVKRIELPVTRQVDVPPGEDVPRLGQRQIGFLLPITVVHIHRRDVEAWVGQIVEIIIGVFETGVEMPVAPLLVQGSLGKEVGVPLPVFVTELARLLPHEGAGIAAFRIIEVEFHPPVSVGNTAVKALFHAQCPHVAVLAHGGGVVAVALAVSELVPSRGVEIFGAEGTRNVLSQFLFPED